MNNILQELKGRMKARMDKDQRFSDEYRKIVMDYLTEIVNDISQRQGGNGK